MIGGASVLEGQRVVSLHVPAGPQHAALARPRCGFLPRNYVMEISHLNVRACRRGDDVHGHVEEVEECFVPSLGSRRSDDENRAESTARREQ